MPRPEGNARERHATAYVVDEQQRNSPLLEVVYLGVESIRPHPNAAHLHSNSQLRRLQRSMRAFGVLRPVLIDVDGNIIDGVAIWLVAKRVGLDTI